MNRKIFSLVFSSLVLMLAACGGGIESTNSLETSPITQTAHNTQTRPALWQTPTLFPTTTNTLAPSMTSSATLLFTEGEEKESNSIQPEEYRVYNKIIDYLINDFYPYMGIQHVVIKNSTVIEYSIHLIVDSLDYVSEMIPEINSLILQDFRKKNSVSYSLNRKFVNGTDYILVSEDEMAEIIRKGIIGWEEFYNKNPHSFGILSFSRVGFNSEKNQALVYFSNYCDIFNAFGYFVFLSLDGEVWVIEQMELLWIS